ncbi:MAG: acyl-coenzyme A thioesterase PaaI-like protein [Arenicella sp.]|jgi:acyl-coenzyme A thioesterase PaaI-like protein
MPSIFERYQRLKKIPGGNVIFAKLVCFSAPFFSNIRPIFVDLRPAYCQTQMKDRRGVRNHLGTINAGALCSMAEMTGGLALDSIVPSSLRWIPRTMTVQYLAKATGTITAISEFNPSLVKEGDVVIPIVISNAVGDIVFTADITFYVSKKVLRKAA